MVVDAQAWLAECAAHILLHQFDSPRCGEDDLLTDTAARQLAGELMEDPAYRNLEPAQAAERFRRDCE